MDLPLIPVSLLQAKKLNANHAEQLLMGFYEHSRSNYFGDRSRDH